MPLHDIIWFNGDWFWTDTIDGRPLSPKKPKEPTVSNTFDPHTDPYPSEAQRMIPQQQNISAQDDVDRLMVRSRLNEAIASLLRVREHFQSHRPTSSRDKATIACDRSIKALRDHLDIIDLEIAEARLENPPRLPS